MICPECEREYQFEAFNLDWESFQIFGSFCCGCQAKLVLPEKDCIKLGLLDPEARQQLRNLRLLSYRLLRERELNPLGVLERALAHHQPLLLYYLRQQSFQERA